MKIDDYVDSEEVCRQIESGMIKAQRHPTETLSILNYTQKAQFTPELWNETTDKCRGLIFNHNTGELVSRGFVKFWNYSDARHPETTPENLPSTPGLITRKMDGSLGIGYWMENSKFAVATRGSFNSEQAQWATRWAKSNGPFAIPEGWTPLFEIIYPQNQIVVNYSFSGLVLLALVNNETGEEANYKRLKAWAHHNRLRVVESFDKPLAECVAEDEPNEEGYVISWPRKGTWPLRVKVKYSTYCTLHKLLTQTSILGIWEMLRDGKGISEVVKDAPKDFADWAEQEATKLLWKFTDIECDALDAFDKYEGTTNIANAEEKKAFALYATTKGRLTPILFSMLKGLDRKNYESIIWKMIRPSGSRTFKVEEE